MLLIKVLLIKKACKRFVNFFFDCLSQWCHGVVVITTAQLHSTKLEFRFCAGSNSARDLLEIRDGEDL